MKARAIPILMLLSGLFGSIVATVARPHPQEKPDELSEPEALGLMRMINTFQVAPVQGPRHQYVSLEELVAQRHEKAHELLLSTVLLKDSSTGTLKNYTVSIVVSADGQHYVAQLISSSSCASALFSNESGVIYTARGLGCPQVKSESKGN
ncbi:MAG TPA: hypothetical protein VKP61_04410 [Candidatus Acidoferrum sp.]|nr:hypothetical protein [Candidatus Acidoferrum sp.]